ncbi:MAG: hypothetical protein M3Q55_15270 [Acidobacteriota bacterium]|nr:hypothetical protein [Acidobacteriota bacterium]
MPSLIAYVRAETAPSWSPVIPPAWESTPEVPGRMSLYPQGRATSSVIIASILVSRDSSFPSRGLFVFTGAQAVLDVLAARVAADALVWTRTWATLTAFRAEAADAALTRLRAAWPDDRPRTYTGTPGSLVAGAPYGERYAVRLIMTKRSGAVGAEEIEDGES